MGGGTGLQNLRECILWTEEKFDFEPKLKKPFWKQMSKNFIERYCYLIVFATYLRERAQRNYCEWFQEFQLYVNHDYLIPLKFVTLKYQDLTHTSYFLLSQFRTKENSSV